jgi:ABC-type sugar transport system permease subunit
MEKKKKRSDLKTQKAISGYLFILPFIIGFLAFMVSPLIESLRMSLSNVKIVAGSGGFIMEFIGIDNFKRAFFVDPEFNRMLVDEIRKMAVDVPAILIFSFIIAILLNQNFKGRGFVRAIFFLPVILSSGVLVGLEYNNSLLSGMQEVIKKSSAVDLTEVLQEILLSSGFGERTLKVVFDIINHVYDIAIASGIQIIVFLSGLQTISSSMYEAAKIEGCTVWESFWKITLPMVSPLILVNLIYTIIDFFIKSDSKVMDKISTTMISKMDYGFASAMAWVYFGAVILMIAVFGGIVSRLVFYDD